MKKAIITILAVIMTLCITVTAVAVEVTNCVVYAENVTASAGGQVNVPVKISSNSGFTNFGIALDYDSEVLELVSITPDKMCGELVAVNTAWEPSADENAKDNGKFENGRTYGYVVCASDGLITGDGELFTATFKVKSNFADTATVTPVISYMRNDSAEFAVFADIDAKAENGVINASDVLMGDVDGNGSVTVKDALLVYKAYCGLETLTDAQKIAADMDGNGSISVKDAFSVYKIFRGV